MPDRLVVERTTPKDYGVDSTSETEHERTTQSPRHLPSRGTR